MPGREPAGRGGGVRAAPSAPSEVRRLPWANPGAAPRCHHGSVDRTPPTTIKKRTAAGPLLDGGGGGSPERTVLWFRKAGFPPALSLCRSSASCHSWASSSFNPSNSPVPARWRSGAAIQPHGRQPDVTIGLRRIAPARGPDLAGKHPELGGRGKIKSFYEAINETMRHQAPGTPCFPLRPRPTGIQTLFIILHRAHRVQISTPQGRS